MTLVAAGAAAVAALGAYVIAPQVGAYLDLRTARGELRDGDVPAARAHLDRCLAVWAGSGEVQFLAARAARRDGDRQAAELHLGEAARLGWDPVAVRLEKLLARVEAGAVDHVEGDLQAHLAIATADDEPVILEAIARGCLKARRLDLGYGYTKRWVDKYPGDWAGHYWHARVLEQGLRNDLAIEDYRKALALRPGHPDSRLRLAWLLLGKGEYAEAITHFETYLQAQPDAPAALLGLARAQRAARPPEEARATLDRLLAQPVDHPQGWLLRGQLDLDADRPADAIAAFRKAADALPYERDAHKGMADALRLLGRDAEAAPHYEKFQQLDRDIRAVDELMKKVNADPKNAALRYDLGVTLGRIGQTDDAIRFLVSALMLDPAHKPTREALAAAIARLNDPQLEALYRPLLTGR